MHKHLYPQSCSPLLSGEICVHNFNFAYAVWYLPLLRLSYTLRQHCIFKIQQVVFCSNNLEELSALTLTGHVSGLRLDVNILKLEYSTCKNIFPVLDHALQIIKQSRECYCVFPPRSWYQQGIKTLSDDAMLQYLDSTDDAVKLR